MKKRILFRLILSLWVMSVFGCGFGGFSDSSNSGTSSGDSDSANDTKVSGVVSKGLFKNGTVRFYAVNFDGSETLLKTTSIGAFGNYSARLSSQKTITSGSYNGVVLIKATGSYIDEATGAELTIDDSHPLRAIIANPSGTLNASVTALTELATRKALAVQRTGNQLAATDVTNANALVSEMFKVDIIATKPVEPDLSDYGFGRASTTQAQKDYTLALAAISQMARNNAGTLASTLNVLADDIADGAITAENATTLQTALITFLASDRNVTGVKSINSTNLANAGGSLKIVRLGTAEKLGAGNIIGGVTVTLKLPPGVTLRADLSAPEIAEKEPLSGVVKGSGVIAAGVYVKASYIASSGALPGMVTLSLAGAHGFAVGEFATIMCDVPAGMSLNSTNFSIYKNLNDPNDPKNFKAVDGNGAAFPADIITVEVLPD
ncbi:hypothetical protein [Geotalea uraniireducens]|uniref:Lipoprotein n=1 Tax=Geotalea uraniireducens (strain Rf4) TaxID=351605 RepID=A5GAN7_GEOUR|nr:hypothetical protein [Geotalea uraniireducens]ABQ25366.1 hypothetical protein Gura_1162 [Geotalea uraniireducens Rf4]